MWVVPTEYEEIILFLNHTVFIKVKNQTGLQQQKQSEGVINVKKQSCPRSEPTGGSKPKVSGLGHKSPQHCLQALRDLNVH